MKIMFLGYGSNSFSSINTVSFLAEEKDKTVLFDCGPSVTNNLHKYVSNFGSITDVFISHSHFDHFLGLPYFVIGRHLDILALKKNNPDYIPSPLNVYLPAGLSDLVKQLLEKCHSDVKELSYPLHFYTLEDEYKYHIDMLTVMAFGVNHTVASFGFSIFTDASKVLTYSSDTLYSDEIVKYFLESKYLILEGMIPNSELPFSKKAKHATFEQAVGVAETVNPIRTFLVHLQPRYLGKQNEIIGSLTDNTNVNISFPEVGVWYELCV